MKISVTGAHGHVGVNLCKTLVQEGHDVVALAHKNTAGLQGLPVKIVKGDLLDKESLRPLLKDTEVVLHLAARISIVGDPDGMVERINSEGTQNILNLSTEMGIRRFIHFSSIHAFQQAPHNQVLDEKRPLVGDTGFAYDRSKAKAERAVTEAGQKGLDTVILSPTAIIGPADPQPSLSGKAVLNLYNRKIPSLIPGGYDWVDVRDVVNAALASITKGRRGEKYLISGKWYNLKEFASIIHDVTGRKIVRTVLPLSIARIGLPLISAYSAISKSEPLYTSESLTIISEGSRMITSEKAKKELGYECRPLHDTIYDLIRWFGDAGILSKSK